jgi:1,4-dihydroxy-2-naphthoate octaprenyltransferase
MALEFDPLIFLFSIAIGLMGVNVLLVNNYRDEEDDRAAGKKTQTVMRGRPVTALAYLLNGYTAIAMLATFWIMIFVWHGKTVKGLEFPPLWTLAIPLLYLVLHTITWFKLKHRDGAALNPLLGATARNMLIFTILFTIVFIIYS